MSHPRGDGKKKGHKIRFLKMPSFLEKEKGTTDPTEKLATGEICVVDEEIGVGFGIPQIKLILVMEDGGTPCKKAKAKARGEEKEILDEEAG